MQVSRSRFRPFLNLGLAMTLWLTFSATGQGSDPSPVISSPAPQQAGELMQQILQSNHHYRQTHAHDFYARIQNSQHPQITLLSCSDSRTHSVSFIQDPTNHIFSIRNIGNQIHNNLGSVDYGIEHLKTPVLLIMGHTHCGAIDAAMHNYAEESFAIVQEIDHLAIPLRSLLQQPARPEDQELLWARGVEKNVDYQVHTALKRYASEVKAQRLTIIGAVYDLTDTYGAGEGQVVLTNLNGETDPDKIRQNPLFDGIQQALLQQAVHRLAN